MLFRITIAICLLNLKEGASMNYRKKFIIEAGDKIRLEKLSTNFTGKYDSHEDVKEKLEQNLARMKKLQYLLYANGGPSLLIVLQARDAAGKDGVIRHLFTGMNPQGTKVVSFKQPTPAELGHDFLWRIHPHVPNKGEITIFNRSHYEDVLVTRVHNLISKKVCVHRYDIINNFEELLSENGTRILKFFLHISPEEQLARFKQRLDDPERQWKISESDYSERELWPDYTKAYQDVLQSTSTKQAPWYVIPSDHKWFRNLAVSEIIADTLDEMKLKLPPTHVDIDKILKLYTAAEQTLVKAI
jgi:PPK2 family polyphosphate:nucleotide phosphotransferase